MVEAQVKAGIELQEMQVDSTIAQEPKLVAVGSKSREICLTDVELPENAKSASVLKRAHSRILEDSDSWTDWLTPKNWLLAGIYSAAFSWIGFTECVLASLISAFMDQCGVGAAKVSLIYAAASCAYLIAAFSSSILQRKLRNGHLQLGVGMIIGSLPLFAMKQMRNIWLLALLWFVQGIGRGICEPNIGAFGFAMTVNEDGNSDSVFGALLFQTFMLFFGIGAVTAPLSLQISELLTDSYAAALWFFGAFGILVGVALLLTEAPKVVVAETGNEKEDSKEEYILDDVLDDALAEDSLSKRSSQLGSKRNSLILAIEPSLIPLGAHVVQNSLSGILPLVHENIVDITTVKDTAADGEENIWAKVVCLMTCFIAFFGGTIQTPLTAFIGNYTEEHLDMGAAVGRYLNAVYFGSRMIGCLLWVFPMRTLEVASNVSLMQFGYQMATGIVFVHALSTSNGAHSWMLYIGFAITGLSHAVVLSLSLQFIDTVVGTSAIWGSLVLGMFFTGSAVGGFVAGLCIDEVGHYTLPYYLLCAALCGTLAVFSILTLSRWRLPPNALSSA